MGATVAESSLSAAALVAALNKVSGNAVPGLVDALLLTTQCSPSSLLLGLLQQFPDTYQRGAGDSAAECVKGEVDMIHTYLTAIVHLLKNKESEQEDLLRALWTVFVPVLRSRNPELSILQLQVAETLAETTSARSQWDALKESLVALCLNSLYPFSQLEGENASAEGLKYIAYSGWQRLEKVYKVVSRRRKMTFHDELLSIYAVTQLVAALLNTALDASRTLLSDDHDEKKVDGDASSPQKFCEDITSVFLAPALAKLSQPLDEPLRRYSMQNLLPPLLKSAARFGWLDDVSPENRTADDRASPVQEVWSCCQALLSHGSSQRQDAYMALALFSEFLLPSELSLSRKVPAENMLDIGQYKHFDIQDQVEFWEVLKMGLGDADPLIRKRALHIFKIALSGLKSTAGSKNLAVVSNASPQRDISRKAGKVAKLPISTKRSKWAEEEAASLGVAAVKDKVTLAEGWSQRWDAFILLLETLEEYGTHLVEAAWSHQMSLLLQFTNSKGDARNSGPYWADTWSQKKSRSVDVNFTWISVLWQRGFDHTNPQGLTGNCYLQDVLEWSFQHLHDQVAGAVDFVHSLFSLQSFLEFEWARIRKLSSLLPEEYVMGSLLQALDDAVQHRDFGSLHSRMTSKVYHGIQTNLNFLGENLALSYSCAWLLHTLRLHAALIIGMKGIYSSATAEGAAKFMSAYSGSMPPRRRLGFVVRLAKGLLSQSRTRPGLMTLTICLEAAALGLSAGKSTLGRDQILQIYDAEMFLKNEGPADVLELLKSVVENSKRHFNPRYREKVCSHVLRAVSALVVLPNVPFSRFASFLSSFPRDHLICSGSLHDHLMSWIHPTGSTSGSGSHSDVNNWVLEGLRGMVELYLELRGPISSPVTDEDVEAWRLEAGRWARLLVIGLLESRDVLGILLLIQQHALQMCNHPYTATHTPVRVLLLIQCLFKESTSPSGFPSGSIILSSDGGKSREQSEAGEQTPTVLTASISKTVLSIMDEIKDYARRSAAIFWEYDHSGPVVLPASVSGKLGGPSQRRLPCTLTSAVLQAVLSISTVADCCLWCCSVGRKADIPESVLNFMWQYAWEVVATQRIATELHAELQLGAYEALTSICRALAATAHPFFVSAAHASMTSDKTVSALLPVKAESMVDGLIKALLQNVDASALVGALARSRRAVLASCKWSCLDSLLSIPKSAVSGHETDQLLSAASDLVLEGLLQDTIASLESAGEEYLLPLLKSIRWLMHWGALGQVDTDEDSGKKYQVMWTLVQSGWSAMADCTKRKVAPTAAFLSAIFHPAIFGDLEMHGSLEDEEEHGPLKWLLNRLIEQGSRSPRTMRLTALHVTGLWLMFPGTTIFYMPELKTLALHGGESVDEELDGEILENRISAREYATLIESSDPELTQEFTNSEMYVRVMVAVMVHKLASLVEDQTASRDDAGLVTRMQALNFGQRFLLVLLNATATDSDLSKELYKKKSAIHRRKVRVWQLLCILSRFLCADDVLKVNSLLKICLYKNNMPSVRQYIEMFAIQFYLRFPDLIEESLIPVLQDYNMKTQALSSYVLIATNVLMFTPEPRQKALLQIMLPAILPFMTSHHHNLRSFTQVLIYKILHRFSDPEGFFTVNQGAFAEGHCLQSIADYLKGNADCTRMRMSVEKHMDAYDPVSMTQPRGIFCSKGGEIDPSRSAEDHPFECVPVAVLDQVGNFLSEAREELRESMAADAMALNTEQYSKHPNAVDTSEHHTDSQSSQMPNQSNVGVSAVGMSSPGLDSSVKVVRESPGFLPSGNFDIQKKIASLRFSDANTAYDVEDELLLSSVESRAKELIRMRGGRQDLIVVASLLGRVPNLAGLARTCEVFKASTLVIADTSIAHDRQFQLISVTADQWIPLVEIPEAALSEYLSLKRKEGYSVLGLEQTANSVSIDKYIFPDKVVLVLGRESDGIPVDIIQALDTCVEIPQLGVIRSLNVHVSGAIAIWEYTRQHLTSTPQPGDDN